MLHIPLHKQAMDWGNAAVSQIPSNSPVVTAFVVLLGASRFEGAYAKGIRLSYQVALFDIIN